MLPAALISVADAWAGFYKDHTSAEIGIQFLHIGGLLAAGGLALATDRDTLRVPARDRAARQALLESQHGIHAWVLAGLGVVVLSGFGFFLADLDTYLTSTPFWIKMGAVGLLLANGTWMVRLEKTCRADGSADGAWGRLRIAAVASISLWFLTTLLGTVLTNAA